MDERPDNHMDKVLRANREKAHSHMELITADGHHVANVAPTLPLEPGHTCLPARGRAPECLARNVRNGSCRGLDAQRVFG